MIFLRGHLLGFGKLTGLSLDFQSRVNLVFAANEGGKSTLQRFLVGLLYGQLRSDLKVQRRLDPWVEQYKPWHGTDYGGILWCRLADGRELEIHRFFGKDETRIEIRSSTGENITRQYEQQRNGEVLFARSHLGMPKELFESVAMIRENRVAEIPGNENIRDRIANLAQSGDEDLSIRQSLTRLQEALDLIGSERAPTRPYKQAQDIVQNLRTEQKALEERRVQFQGWVEDRTRIAGDMSGMERELLRAQATLLSSRRREISGKVQSLEEIDSQIRDLRAEIEALGARAEFPVERLEELNQLAGAKESLAGHRKEIRTENAAALELLARAEAERQKLASYATIAASPDAEKITEWFVSYLSLSLQKDGIQKTMARLQTGADFVKKRLSQLSPALSDPETDWQRMAREAAEAEQSASQSCALLAEKIAAEKSKLSEAKRTASRWRMIAALFLFLAVMPSAWRLLDVSGLSPMLEFGLAGALAILAAVLFFAASRSAEIGRKSMQTLSSLEAEQKSLRDEGGQKRKRFNEVMSESGFQNMDDFLVVAKQSEQDRQKLADLEARIAESGQQQERLRAQSDDVYQQLKNGLAQAGLSCSPGNLKFQIDVFRTNLRRFRELDAKFSSCVQKAAALKAEDEELTADYDRKCLLMKSLLDQAAVDTPEKFREECRKQQKLIGLLEKEASRNREFQRLAGDLTLEQWKGTLRELMERPGPPDDGIAPDQGMRAEGGENTPFLPYLPTVPEAEEEEKQITSTLYLAREEYARAVERTNQAFRNFRLSSEIEEDLAMAERSLREMETNREALSTALETIEVLSRQQQEVLAPQLNAAVEQRFLRLCGHRYEEVKIDPDFQVYVREPDSGELRLAGYLSRGTQDQLYFAMRFGILDLVSSESEPCPCLLDEPFAAYDRTRLREAFKVLDDESERRQLIVFTCREDLLDLAGQHGANVVLMHG